VALTKTRLLQHALEDSVYSHRSTKAIRDFDHLSPGSSQRESDFLGVLSLRPQGKFSAAFAKRRIQLLCSCVSLTRDFSNFERSCGYVPKKDQLISAISSGRPVAVQRIGRRLGQFITSYSASPMSERTKKALDAAIRLGTKLEILDSIGDEVGLQPGCLSLLMGLDCATLSRLSYSSLRYVRQELTRNTSALAAVTEFSEWLGSWWTQSLACYHERHGSRSFAIINSDTNANAEQYDSLESEATASDQGSDNSRHCSVTPPIIEISPSSSWPIQNSQQPTVVDNSFWPQNFTWQSPELNMVYTDGNMSDHTGGYVVPNLTPNSAISVNGLWGHGMHETSRGMDAATVYPSIELEASF
jgi:hypothetical protein